MIARLQAGEDAAFEPLLDAHLSHVRAFVALRAPVPHLIDEIAHETFVFAYRHIAQFTIGGSFRAWVRAIAWNLLRAEVQRYARTAAGLSRYAEMRGQEFDRAAQPSAEWCEEEYLELCMSRLSAENRQLLADKYREGLDTAEIASRWRRSLESVRVLLFRLRQQLRKCIEAKMRETGHV